jgi:peptidoglycan/xylan/chitin deacetylase (PgdA/CDA1 family)
MRFDNKWQAIMQTGARLWPRALVLLLFILAGLWWPHTPARAAPEEPRPDPQPKVLYLTFDDGPSGFTQQILEVLARHNAKATFFVLGRQAQGRQDFLRAMYDAGHGIANHTYNHPSLPSVSKQRFRDEVLGTTDAIGGLDHGCLRPPYGAANKTVAAEAAELGYSLVTWSIDPRDWTRPGAAAIAGRVVGRAFPGGVVVMHDGGGDRSQTVAALETILTELGAQGYQFAALCREGAPAPFTPPQQPQPGMGPENTLPTALEIPPAPPPPSGPSGGIVAPAAGGEVRGQLEVQGFAVHPTFRKWQLDLLIDGTEETFLALGETPSAEPTDLFVWDTTLYPNGEHLLRLRVVYEGLNYDEYAVPVKITN